MTHDEAVTFAIYGDVTNWTQQEKYNRTKLTFSITNGKPNPNGFDWVASIETVYGRATDWSFQTREEHLTDRWTQVSEDYLDDMLSDEEIEAWKLLGYEFPARED